MKGVISCCPPQEKFRQHHKDPRRLSRSNHAPKASRPSSEDMGIKEDLENGKKRIVHEEVREPLMKKTNQSDEQDGSSAQNSSKENAWMVYLSTFVAAGYSSPTQDAIRKDLSLSLAEYSMFGSILTFGAMIGAITSGPIADLIGRKWAMRVATSFCVAGWLAIYFAKSALVLDLGRLATGYGMGVFSYVVPVFIAEIAPKNLRGALTTTNQNRKLTPKVLAGLVPCAILIFGLFLIPESPRWLARRGREREFETALQKLRGKDADISHEAAEIKDYIETLERLPKAKLFDLFQRRYLRSVIIGVGLMVFQQFGGINGVCFYVSNIFESAGKEVVVTALNTTVIDKAGRKPLLLVNFYPKQFALKVSS
ncbi:unnamed protein product [Dovyalis caffra]|uniref:Major facilitator superfamily (MFS) profile domain-containing protein n=1 Tax=Dovyalis caffra TaxID=77055 RepID=A0AAV1S9U8_9ROSI|nr:unnamed protein product [Dovyalis caffra]